MKNTGNNAIKNVVSLPSTPPPTAGNLSLDVSHHEPSATLHLVSSSTPTPVLIPPSDPPFIREEEVQAQQLAFDFAALMEPPKETPHKLQPPKSRQAQQKLSAWVARMSVAIIETVTGHRPPHHVMNSMKSPIYETFVKRLSIERHNRAAKTYPPARLLTCHITHCYGRRKTVEASATVFDGERNRLVCFCVEYWHRRWVIDALEFD